MPQNNPKTNGHYRISTDQAEIDVAAVHKYLTTSYWSAGIPLEVVNKAIQNSLCFGVFKAKQQIGFARLVTDKATFAYLADVYILQEHRGQGLSKRLLDKILQHQDCQGLRRIVLATKDAHDLYKKYNFKQLSHPETFMELWTPDAYD